MKNNRITGVAIIIISVSCSQNPPLDIPTLSIPQSINEKSGSIELLSASVQISCSLKDITNEYQKKINEFSNWAISNGNNCLLENPIKECVDSINSCILDYNNTINSTLHKICFWQTAYDQKLYIDKISLANFKENHTCNNAAEHPKAIDYIKH
ncbi:hypothetical protein JWZ98_05945 [Methylomonas sp. EFPC1]|uniref:hypothetical protein n=1 Tax=Methylomonas sp. EFPC1 TaxID=2812647 RepID=UPI0019675A77|nr:hypothetical protein [Methylomonas sp. EFPC1]QSB02482.1 hypothetical protein JWZ98_05945 [Methylomonas sp. EFPC1]